MATYRLWHSTQALRALFRIFVVVRCPYFSDDVGFRFRCFIWSGTVVGRSKAVMSGNSGTLH